MSELTLENELGITEVYHSLVEVLQSSDMVRHIFSNESMVHPFAFCISHNSPNSVLIFDLMDNTIDEAESVIRKLKYRGFTNMGHPARSSHSQFPAFSRRRSGISDSLIWIQVTPEMSSSSIALFKEVFD